MKFIQFLVHLSSWGFYYRRNRMLSCLGFLCFLRPEQRVKTSALLRFLCTKKCRVRWKFNNSFWRNCGATVEVVDRDLVEEWTQKRNAGVRKGGSQCNWMRKEGNFVHLIQWNVKLTDLLSFSHMIPNTFLYKLWGFMTYFRRLKL